MGEGQQQPLLRVGPLRLGRGHSEEFAIEPVGVGQRDRGGDVAVVLDVGVGQPGRARLRGCEGSEVGGAGEEIGAQPIQVVDPGQGDGRTDDGELHDSLLSPRPAAPRG